MNMKEHILAALMEQFKRWEDSLAGLSEAQLTAPRYDLDWSIKDVVAHLWAWQQVSLARMRAAAADREPELPAWLAGLEGDWEENVDQTNAWIYAATVQKSWSEVYADWRKGFLLLLESAEPILEKDLLSSDKYPWLNGCSLAFVLVASYDHHQEHLEKVMASLCEPGNHLEN